MPLDPSSLTVPSRRRAWERHPREVAEIRQSRVATAPAHWQPVIQHYLVWRMGMAARRATRRKSEPSTGIK